MKGSVLLLALVALAMQAHAQPLAQARLPVLRPRISMLASFPDTGRGLLPGPALVSPNGRLFTYRCGASAYGVGSIQGYLPGHDVCISAALSHGGRTLIAGSVHGLSWGPKGDAIVLTTDAGQLRYPLQYQGEELTRDGGMWMIRVDSMSGEVVERPHLVARVTANRPPVLSPDERMIAFVWPHVAYVMSLAVVPAAGGTPRILASGIEVRHPQWSADGSALYYDAHLNASSQTRGRFRVPVSGGVPVLIEQQRPTRAAIGSEDLAQLRDPMTGTTVAYLALPDSTEVAVYDQPSRAQRTFAGYRIARPRGLRVVNLANGAIRELIDTTREVLGAPEWFGDERVAVIIRQDGRLALHAQGADGRDARTYSLLRGGSGEQLRVSPDGRYAVFVGRDGGFDTIELVDLASGRQKTLAASPDDFADGSAPEGKTFGALAWGADSKRVRYIADVGTPERTVHEVTLTGADTTVRRLPNFIYGPQRASFPSMRQQPDFVELAGSRDFTGGAAVVLVPIGAGPPRVILPELSLGGPVSPNGRTLAVQMGTPGGQGVGELRLVSLDGSSVQAISLPFIGLAGVQWHPDGHHLVMLGRDTPTGPLKVYSLPSNGDAPSVVASAGSIRDEAFAVSPDGRFIAVTVSGTPAVTYVKLQYDVSAIRFRRGDR